MEKDNKDINKVDRNPQQREREAGCDVPCCSFWYSSWGSRKQVSTCSPVTSSISVWNVSIGWAWFSESQMAFRFRLVSDKGRYWRLETKNELGKINWALLEAFTGCRTRRGRGVRCSRPVRWEGNEVCSHVKTRHWGTLSGPLPPVVREAGYDRH